MNVEFDPAKDKANRLKHGISLRRAVDFDMGSAVLRLDDRYDYGEVRYNALGFLDGWLCVLTFTMRSEMVRAISLRKAEAEEWRDYEADF